MANSDGLPEFRTGQIITEDDLNAIVSAIRFLRGLPVKFAVLALLIGVLSWQKEGTSIGMMMFVEALRLIVRVNPDDLLSVVLVTLASLAIAWVIAPRGRRM